MNHLPKLLILLGVAACGTGVHVNAPTLSGGQFRVVVQRGSSALDVSPALVDDPGRELATKSSTVPVSQ